jgi:hypothetical protein
MQRMGKRALALLALFVGCSSAFAEDSASRDRKRWWGFDVGFFRPNSSEIRNAFDDYMIRFGFRPFEDRISEKWRVIFDFTVLAADRNDNRLLAIPVTVGVTRSLGSPESDLIPFVQAGIGPAYYDYSIVRGTERISTKRVGGNANLELGVLMSRRLAIVGRADFYTETDDFDFSGVSLTVSWAAFRW